MITFWYRKKLPVWAYLLIPLTWIYRLAFVCHKQSIKASCSQKKYPIPIIVVGNLTVGGVGKTPIVIELVAWLKKIGFRPGIITRGYGRENKQVILVKPCDDPTRVGDESILLFQKTQCPVGVANKRTQAIDLLLEKTDVNIILSDDGLQHHALKADLNIVVMDPRRGFGNGYCLPLGPLRESVERLKSVDFILSDFKINLTGSVYNLWEQDNIKTLDYFKQKTVHAVAGIGDPEKFFQSLEQAGLLVIRHIFPDHYPFQGTEFNFKENYPILTTEKDAVKLGLLSKSAVRNKPIWVLPITVEIDLHFKTRFLKKYRSLNMLDNKLLDILVCPICKGKLEYDRKKNELICHFDKLAYPVRDNIPIMLEDQARDLQVDNP